MDLRALDKSAGSPFIMNTIPRNGEFLVRGGLGLVREFSTTLNCGRTVSTDDYGLGHCIGAHHVRTSWGADQILSIHPVLGFTGNYKQGTDGTNRYGRRATYLQGVAAVVQDLHSGKTCEFILHYQDATIDDLSQVFPNYTTRFDEDHATWARADRIPEWAVFADLSKANARNVVVAIDGLGLWTYFPIDPAARVVDRKNDSLDRAVLPPAAGENGAFAPLSLADGVLLPEDGFTYVRDVDLGTVDALATYNGDRVVYAVGNTLFFSDPFLANNVLADSRFVLPTPDVITMVASTHGALLVATARQTWLYQPSLGSVTVAAGILTELSDAVGCINNRAYVGSDAGVFFADETGVWAYTGGVALKKLSAEVDRLWTDKQSLQMPLTDYYVATGISALASPQVPARIDVRAQMRGARLEWHQDLETLYCVCDDVTLCWTQNFGWHVWYMKTHAGNATAVQGEANIEWPSFVSVNADLYVIGGPDITTYTANSITLDDKSCYLLKLGRGGGTDRSADVTLEDQRQPIGGYTVFGTPASGAALFVGPPVSVPANWVAPGGATFAEETYWFLISVGGVAAPTLWELWFQFSTANWTPIVLPGDDELDFNLPAERISSMGGYSQGAPVAGREARVYGGGLPNPGGDEIRISFGGGGGFTINATVNGPDPLIWIGFRYIGTGTQMWLAPTVTTATVNATSVPVYWWQEGKYLTQRTALGQKEQPVDWAVKSRQVYLNGQPFKIRGVFLEAQHLGAAPTASQVLASWRYGPLNTSTSTDYMDYSGQAMDQTATPPGNTEQTGILERARLRVTNPANDPALKTANNIARWGSTSDTSKGNLLIDDAAVDSLATSDGSQGERGSVMAHGTINSMGEGVRLGRIEAVVRPTGSRKRWHA